ncbi:MAG: polysaccharide deacetylase family protein [Helicobacteraceae bacterium]|jgi:peptidoglycan/xylan/chitin deacetylase (PgdA/CDA1 family)|nr:polysaccharide deacetylase family protein [Helicobacteraceae bacterium]
MRKLLLLTLLPLYLWADAHLFVFHRFNDTRHLSTNTSIATLRAEFEYLKKNNYEVVSLKRLQKALQSGEEISDKWVVLTIDDSFKSFYKNGLPLFKEYNYPFTLFVYVQGTVDHYGDFMTWDQIKETSKYGEIGFHSFGHPHLVSLSNPAIYQDTKKGLDIMQKELGYTPKYYAYPYGEYDDRVRAQLEPFSFDLIINQNAGAVDKDSAAHDLDRTALTGENNIKVKLRTRTMPTEWISPKAWPKNGKISTLKATLPKEIKRVEYYISGYGWKSATVNSGKLVVNIDKKLKMNRTRIFLKSGNRQSSIILVKGK